MHILRGLDTLLAGLIFLASLYQCYAVPTRAIPRNAAQLPPIESLNYSLSSTERAWAFKSFYQPSTNFTSPLNKSYELTKRDGKTTPYFKAEWIKNWGFWLIKSAIFETGRVTGLVGAIQPMDQVLGEGGQGTVKEGFWYSGTSEKEIIDSCADLSGETAIKISSGAIDYVVASVVLPRLESQYIVKSFLSGLEQTVTMIEGQQHTSTTSIVAYERLDMTVEAARRDKTLTGGESLYTAVMEGSLAAVAKGYYNMDLKPDNIMLRIKSAESDPEFVIIDWGMIEEGNPYQIQTRGYAGTLGYMAPEMMKVKLTMDRALPYDGSLGWQPGPAMMFTIGMIFFNLQNAVYRGTPTAAMRTYARAIFGKGHQLADNHYQWYWISFVQAYLDEETIRLPEQYGESGEYPEWGAWFSKVLGPPDNRYTLQEAWNVLQGLL
ncbi:serine/threonine-protein kinase IKS1 [Penicillium hispanicum]|uniref:serine/threonine-protein kinase IKS1 n=1 Tax=Penicillium hispanicum TaxID=1080232 RepID=UPI002541015E|nr:serine/threonine-protein kinase IKS1 [Penicillium hispanicum]KAJ5595123.1 serine/threonine-protein kinase IKS1 [Penicillium hispanicum]